MAKRVPGAPSQWAQSRPPIVRPVIQALMHEFGVTSPQAHKIVKVCGAAWRDQLVSTGACRVPELITIRIERLGPRWRRDPRNQRRVRVPAASFLWPRVTRRIRAHVFGKITKRSAA